MLDICTPFRRLGRRRSWIVLTQLLLGLLIGAGIFLALANIMVGLLESLY